MADCDSMGRGLEPFLARFWNFLLEKLSREFKLRRMSIFHEIQKNGHISVLREATVTRLECWYSCTSIVHVDMTLIGSKVKVKVTGLPKFRKLPKIALF